MLQGSNHLKRNEVCVVLFTSVELGGFFFPSFLPGGKFLALRGKGFAFPGSLRASPPEIVWSRRASVSGESESDATSPNGNLQVVSTETDLANLTCHWNWWVFHSFDSEAQMWRHSRCTIVRVRRAAANLATFSTFHPLMHCKREVSRRLSGPHMRTDDNACVFPKRFCKNNCSQSCFCVSYSSVCFYPAGEQNLLALWHRVMVGPMPWRTQEEKHLNFLECCRTCRCMTQPKRVTNWRMVIALEDSWNWHLQNDLRICNRWCVIAMNIIPEPCRSSMKWRSSKSSNPLDISFPAERIKLVFSTGLVTQSPRENTNAENTRKRPVLSCAMRHSNGTTHGKLGQFHWWESCQQDQGALFAQNFLLFCLGWARKLKMERKTNWESSVKQSLLPVTQK